MSACNATDGNGAEAMNKAEVRERICLAAKLHAPLNHVVAPPPLHDFTHDASAHFGMPKSGVPGRRMLWLSPELAPESTHACNFEPEGQRTNPEDVLKVVEERDGHVVYRCTFQDLPPHTPAIVTHRMDSQQRSEGLSGQESLTRLRPFYAPESEEDTVLVFESRFESGNLASAHQVAPFEYDLKLSNDTATQGHTQWFYFSVSNTRKGIPYKFNINNMLKSDSLYNHGQRPLAYSIARRREESMGWHRTGTQILYYGNKICAPKKKGMHCHTLTFTITFSHDDDTCYLSHCYPYTYSDLQVYLDKLELNPECRSFIRRKTLCETEAGNKCDVLTITSRSVDEEDMKHRKGVIISARVHPGETNASWMMKGVIDYLVSDKVEAIELRRRFVFKIVPMLCPDGVINGNYRCGIAGHDMNRRWAKPHPKQHSTIFNTKLMIEDLMQDREVVLFCDLHGHSRKKNVFLFGCDSRYWNRKLNSGPAPVALAERVFPMLMEENSQSFAFHKCRFKVQKSKSSTGRVVTWRQMGIHNSYTVEASFCGPDKGDRVGMHFDIPELEKMGKCICLSIHAQFGKDAMCHLLERVSASLPQGHHVDSDSDSDDSSSDDEVMEVKTPAKSKAGKNAQNTRGRDTPERPASAMDSVERELSKDLLQPANNARRIQPRLKSARPTYRSGSHRQPTLSARARTAEPRHSDAFSSNSFKDIKDKLREIELPMTHKQRVLHEVHKTPDKSAPSGGCGYMSLTDEILAEESHVMMRLMCVNSEDRVDMLREKKKEAYQGDFTTPSRRRPPRGAAWKDNETPARSPLESLQDLQRIAVKTRVETATPVKTVHTLLFTADLPEESPVLRSANSSAASLDWTRQRRILRTPSPVRKVSAKSLLAAAACLEQGVEHASCFHHAAHTHSRISAARPASAHTGGRGHIAMFVQQGRVLTQRSPSPMRGEGRSWSAVMTLGRATAGCVSESPLGAIAYSSPLAAAIASRAAVGGESLLIAAIGANPIWPSSRGNISGLERERERDTCSTATHCNTLHLTATHTHANFAGAAMSGLCNSSVLQRSATHSPDFLAGAQHRAPAAPGSALGELSSAKHAPLFEHTAHASPAAGEREGVVGLRRSKLSREIDFIRNKVAHIVDLRYTCSCCRARARSFSTTSCLLSLPLFSFSLSLVSLSLSLSLFLLCAFSLWLSLSRACARALFLSLSLSFSRALSFSRSHSLSFSFALSLCFSHTFACFS